MDFLQLLDIIKVRVAFWASAVGSRDQDKKPTADPLLVWEKPPAGAVKFNVDGSSLGKSGPAGIGGVLRDRLGVELARISKSIGVEDSNTAELLAIREAFLIFITSPFVLDKLLIVESDSANAVNWVNFPESAPWRVQTFINHIECLKL
ncbi:hypothetical protein PTKIN_Ptkin17bG0045500 [Pterospermum kingtungense]